MPHLRWIHFDSVSTMEVCTEDSACVSGATCLGLDSSFIFLVVRACASASLPAARILEWLRSFKCQSCSHLVTTDVCADECRDVDKEPIYAIHTGLLTEDIWSQITIQITTGISLFNVPMEIEGEWMSLDSGENSLLSWLQGRDEETILVLEDEDAYDTALSMVNNKRSKSVPYHSTDFLGEIFRCGKLSVADAEIICDEIGYMEERLPAMSNWKNQRKDRLVKEFLNLVGGTKRDPADAAD
jgi:hypothetical protein